ncbi:MAG: trypsin-like peptidase domain-containing protein [candidate division Zixibacteria bacterium]|nr:trypsin-like peptidase domain-containing protein [candidate division Zixibacteria bacterium]
MTSVRILLLSVLIAVSLVGTADANLQEQILSARDRVLPALVHIQPVIKNYSTGQLEKQAVIGSGVIFHTDGYVVTNYHVAGKAERIICTLGDKEQVSASFVGGDPLTDLAVIKLDLENYDGTLGVAEFGNSDSIEVGQFVLAMGSPLSLSRSVSFGVISTRDRYFSADVRLPTGERTGRYNLWIQTDAAINPGNSGGPLVDLSGRVIGINSRATMFANNLGFAIPINVVREVTTSILDHGEVVRSWIGIHCQALQKMEEFFNTHRDAGVLVSSIDPGSPAEVSFLGAGDVILEIDNEPVSARFLEELPAFYNRIAQFKPGSELSLKVLRGDETYSFKITTKRLGDLQGEDFEAEGWGFTVKGITRQMQIDNNLDDSLGVLVTGVKPGGAAMTGSLRREDVVTDVNGTMVAGLTDFVTVYQSLEELTEGKILLTVRRNGSIRYAIIKINPSMKEQIDE